MRPTFRAVALFAAGIPLSAIAVLYDETMWTYGVVYMALGLLLLGVDAVLALPPRRLGLVVETPDAIHLGDRDDLVLHAAAPGWPRRTLLRLMWDVDGPLARPLGRDIVVPADGAVRLRQRVTASRRGIGVVERLWLRWHGPFALMWRQRIEPLDREIAIVPNVRAVRQAAIQFATRDAFFGVKVASQLGEGSEFEALREWAQGMNTRDIDWKRSARHHQLVCKEFHTERNHNVIFAFDTGHLMGAPLDGVPRLDRAINAALLLAYLSLRGGDRVGLFALDDKVRRFDEPVAGVHAFARLQRATAALDYGQAETNFTLGLGYLNARLRRRSLVVLFTEFVDTVTAELMIETIQRVARRHLVLFVTLQDPTLRAILDARPRRVEDVARAVVADDFLRDRSVVLERLRRLGAQCLDVAAPRLGAELINRYLAIKRREMI